MVQDGPFLMRDTLNDPSQMLGYTLPVGLVREFLVTSPLTNIILGILGGSQARLWAACMLVLLLAFCHSAEEVRIAHQLASNPLPVEPL